MILASYNQNLLLGNIKNLRRYEPKTVYEGLEDRSVSGKDASLLIRSGRQMSSQALILQCSVFAKLKVNFRSKPINYQIAQKCADLFNVSEFDEYLR